jgi:hypothetical protein
MKYFDLHVTGKHGFSIPLEIPDEEVAEIFNFENDVINYALEHNHIDEEDVPYIDYVDEIEEEDYKRMKGV